MGRPAALHRRRLEGRTRDDADVRVVRSGGAVAGGLINLSMGQFHGGKSVPVAAISAVAITPDQRGKGVASFLLGELVDEGLDAGAPVSVWYPAPTPLPRTTA